MKFPSNFTITNLGLVKGARTMDNTGKHVRIYDQGFVHGIVIKSGRKYDYVLTLRRPLRVSRINKGVYTQVNFSKADFMVKLKERLDNQVEFKPSKLVISYIVANSK